MSENAFRPWGKAASFAFALGFGVADALLGAHGHSPLPIIGMAAFAAMVLLMVFQLVEKPRPFSWIAWSCLAASMLAIFLRNMIVFAEFMAAAGV